MACINLHQSGHQLLVIPRWNFLFLSCCSSSALLLLERKLNLVTPKPDGIWGVVCVCACVCVRVCVCVETWTWKDIIQKEQNVDFKHSKSVASRICSWNLWNLSCLSDWYLPGHQSVFGLCGKFFAVGSCRGDLWAEPSSCPRPGVGSKGTQRCAEPSCEWCWGEHGEGSSRSSLLPWAPQWEEVEEGGCRGEGGFSLLLASRCSHLLSAIYHVNFPMLNLFCLSR